MLKRTFSKKQFSTHKEVNMYLHILTQKLGAQQYSE